MLQTLTLILGRDWLRTIKLDWQELNFVCNSSLQDLLFKYEDVFQPGLGTLQGLRLK